MFYALPSSQACLLIHTCPLTRIPHHHTLTFSPTIALTPGQSFIAYPTIISALTPGQSLNEPTIIFILTLSLPLISPSFSRHDPHPIQYLSLTSTRLRLQPHPSRPSPYLHAPDVSIPPPVFSSLPLDFVFPPTFSRSKDIRRIFSSWRNI